MRCQEACKLLNEYIDERLSAEKILLLEEHLALCPSCRLEYQNLRQIVEAFRNMPEVTLPPGFPADLRQKLLTEKMCVNEQKRLSFWQRLAHSTYLPRLIAATIVLVCGISIFTFADYNSNVNDNAALPSETDSYNLIPGEKTADNRDVASVDNNAGISKSTLEDKGLQADTFAEPSTEQSSAIVYNSKVSIDNPTSVSSSSAEDENNTLSPPAVSNDTIFGSANANTDQEVNVNSSKTSVPDTGQTDSVIVGSTASGLGGDDVSSDDDVSNTKNLDNILFAMRSFLVIAGTPDSILSVTYNMGSNNDGLTDNADQNTMITASSGTSGSRATGSLTITEDSANPSAQTEEGSVEGEEGSFAGSAHTEDSGAIFSQTEEAGVDSSQTENNIDAASLADRSVVNSWQAEGNTVNFAQTEANTNETSQTKDAVNSQPAKGATTVSSGTGDSTNVSSSTKEGAANSSVLSGDGILPSASEKQSSIEPAQAPDKPQENTIAQTQDDTNVLRSAALDKTDTAKAESVNKDTEGYGYLPDIILGVAIILLLSLLFLKRRFNKIN